MEDIYSLALEYADYHTDISPNFITSLSVDVSQDIIYTSPSGLLAIAAHVFNEGISASDAATKCIRDCYNFTEYTTFIQYIDDFINDTFEYDMTPVELILIDIAYFGVIKNVYDLVYNLRHYHTNFTSAEDLCEIILDSKTIELMSKLSLIDRLLIVLLLAQEWRLLNINKPDITIDWLVDYIPKHFNQAMEHLSLHRDD